MFANIKCINSLLKEESTAKNNFFLIKDSLICFLYKYASRTVSREVFFFLLFQNNGVGRAMGNKAFYWDGLRAKQQFSHCAFYYTSHVSYFQNFKVLSTLHLISSRLCQAPSVLGRS